MAYTLEKLAEYVGGNIIGDAKCQINSVATLNHAGSGQISFLTNTLYKNQLEHTKASAVLISDEFVDLCTVNVIVVNNPHAAYAKVASLLNPVELPGTGHHPTACIADSCQVHSKSYIAANVVLEEGVVIEEGVFIGANSVIGKGTRIGKDSYLHANVTIYENSDLGERAIIHSGVVIGADGFGQAYDNGVWLKVPQLGGVKIGDDVEVGANTCIDCGAIEDTVIEDGVKLDNQIQIGHNVQIGAHTVIAACVAIAGSTKIGKHCMIGGAVGITGHLKIADKVMITAMSFVCKSIKQPGSYSSAVPSEDSRQWHRQVARIKQLDTMVKRLRKLEKNFE